MLMVETVVDHTLGTILTIKPAAVEQEDTPETVVMVSIKTLVHLGLQVLVEVVQVVVLKLLQILLIMNYFQDLKSLKSLM